MSFFLLHNRLVKSSDEVISSKLAATEPKLFIKGLIKTEKNEKKKFYVKKYILSKKSSPLVLPCDSSKEFVCPAKNLPPTKNLVPPSSNIADDGILPTPMCDVDMRFHCFQLSSYLALI